MVSVSLILPRIQIKSEDRSSEDQEGELPPEGEGRLIGPGIEMLPDDVEGDRLRRVPPEEGDSGVVVGEVRRIPVGTTVHIPEHNGLLVRVCVVGGVMGPPLSIMDSW